MLFSSAYPTFHKARAEELFPILSFTTGSQRSHYLANFKTPPRIQTKKIETSTLMANLITRLIHVTTLFHINGMYNFIRKKYYFDVKTSNYKQKDNKDFVILLLLEIYLMGTFSRGCSEKILIVSGFNKIMNPEKCLLSTLCQVHKGLVFLAKL